MMQYPDITVINIVNICIITLLAILIKVMLIITLIPKITTRNNNDVDHNNVDHKLLHPPCMQVEFVTRNNEIYHNKKDHNDVDHNNVDYKLLPHRPSYIGGVRNS